MALQSPGVEVTVIDESFYTPAASGTTPLIVVATAENKSNASGTGIAQGTLAANAGKVYRVSSQRELVDFFGTPSFKKTISGSPRHGDEQNEYGLQAAYSFLGAGSTAYVVRADVNLDDLTAQADAPGSEPTAGQWWLDTQSTSWGIFEWDAAPTNVGGQRFVNKVPLVITDDNTDQYTGSPAEPVAGVGRVGDYAVVAVSDVVRMFYKGKDYTNSEAISWQLVGSQAWRKFWPVITEVTDGHSGLGTGVNFFINGVQISVPSSTDADEMVGLINDTHPVQGVKAAKVNNKVTFFIVGETTEGDGNEVEFTDGSATVTSLFGFAAGTYYGPELSMAPHTQVPRWKSDTAGHTEVPTGSTWVKTTDPNLGARWRIKQWNSSTQAWTEVFAPLYANAHSAIYSLNRSGGGLGIDAGTLYVQYNYTEDTGFDTTPQTASFKIFTRKVKGPTSIVSDAFSTLTGPYSFEISESLSGQAELDTPVVFTALSSVTPATLLAAINGAGFTNVEASISSGKVTLTHKLGGEIRITNTTGDLFEDAGFTLSSNIYASPELTSTFDYVVSNYQPLVDTTTGYVSSSEAPLNEPADGQRWYSSLVDEVDVMVHDGNSWRGYKNVYANTDPLGPIVSATRPLLQSDGDSLVTGDLWIDTSDLENYPAIYKFQDGAGDTVATSWIPIDKGDQTSDSGIVFADARWATSGEDTDPSTIVDLLTSDFVDFDTPSPALYPEGILLFNTRRSGFNVKKYIRNYVDTSADNEPLGGTAMTSYATARWVSDSADQFGRKAQRHVIVQSLKGLINSNQEMREDEVRDFNIIACPGYPETIQNMIELNIDRGTTAFVVGDSPMRLAADSNTLSNWGQNTAAATDNGDTGIVSYDAYTGVFYPSGLTSDNTGSTIMVPASHMILRTIALNDQVAYPWFAPAGIRRGGITNASSAGYLDSATGEFRPVALTEGQRDTLYNVNVNPITYFNGVGLVNYGQKTRSSSSSALDRINVARLVIYLRSQLNKLAKPFVFEPNDKLTRDEMRQAVESLLLELVGLRAIYDYAVVCDETNNTPARIDRNELYVDIAIEPVKSIEFIYIPLRLKNTGEIAASRAS